MSAAEADTSRPLVLPLPNLPSDSTFTVEKPGHPRSQLLYYRTIVRIAFDDTTSGPTIRSLFSRYGATVIGGIPSAVDPEYIIQVPDPGTSIEALNSLLAELEQEPGVKWAASVYSGPRPAFIEGIPTMAPGQQWSAPFLTARERVPSTPLESTSSDLVDSLLSDSLGSFQLVQVPWGQHDLKVKGIGFLERTVRITVDRDTVRLPPISLWPDHRFDSLNIIAPGRGGAR